MHLVEVQRLSWDLDCQTKMAFLGNHGLNPSALARRDDYHLSCLTTGGLIRHVVLPLKTQQENREGPKGGRRHQPIICPADFPEPLELKFILAERRVHHQEGPVVRLNMGQARRLARDSPESAPIAIKPAAWESSPPGSLTLLVSTQAALPNKIFSLLVCVSTPVIHRLVSNKSPLSGPGREPPFLQWSYQNSVMQAMIMNQKSGDVCSWPGCVIVKCSVLATAMFSWAPVSISVK